MNTPTTLKWLIRRELWEHRGSMLWAPVIVAVVLFALIAGTAIWKVAMGDALQFGVQVNGRQVDVANMIAALTPQQRASFANGLASSYLAFAAPLFIMIPGVVFFYCLGALYDERRDRSVLFWKSLPVSDQATVLSKVATALVVAPLVGVAAATACGLAALLAIATLGAFHGINLFGLLLSTPQLYLTPFQLLSLLPVYFLWALPSAGYLLLVSSWARSKVFLWAVGLPLIVAAIMAWVDYLAGGNGQAAKWFMEHIVGAGLAGLMPGTWLAHGDIPERLLHVGDRMVDMGRVVEYSYRSLADVRPWLGAAAGALMLYGAMRMRRWNDEG